MSLQFAYRPAGHYNVTRGYTANGLNQYTQSGSIVPTYDARGNLTSAGPNTYGYDAENKLTHLNGQAWLTWEPGGRLAAVANDAFFGYDGMNLIAESDGVVPITRRYVHGPGIDEPLVWYEGGGLTDRRWLHADERGSIVAVTDNAGNAIAVNSYDEYGIPASTNVGRFQYTGQMWIPGLGMYHYKARIYSPTLGRFLQTDPIGYGDGMNMYAYVGNDPINMVDPNGKERVGWIVMLLKNAERRIRSLGHNRHATEARRREQNVRVTGGRRQARQIERASAENPDDVIHDSGHVLPDGSRGRPHYRTQGKKGHTFYDVAAGLVGSTFILL